MVVNLVIAYTQENQSYKYYFKILCIHTNMFYTDISSLPVFRIDFTQRKFFEILLHQPKIKLYLPFSGWFQVDLKRFRKNILSVYMFCKCGLQFRYKESVLREIKEKTCIQSQSNLIAAISKQIFGKLIAKRYEIFPGSNEI